MPVSKDNGGSQPMQVGGIGNKGKKGDEKGSGWNSGGRSKYSDGWSKGGFWPGKNNSKGTKDGGKGKRDGNKTNYKPTTKFDGWCKGCNKWGHRKADCWSTGGGSSGKGGNGGSQQAQILDGSVSSVASEVGTEKSRVGGISKPLPGTVAEEVVCGDILHEEGTWMRGCSFHNYCAQVLDTDDTVDLPWVHPFAGNKKWTKAVRRTAPQVAGANTRPRDGDDIYVLWDTGSDEHSTEGLGLCMGDSANDMHFMQGVGIATYGESQLDFVILDDQGNKHLSSSECQLSEVNDMVLSAGKVIKTNAFRGILGAEYSHLERKDNPSIRIPLHLIRNSCYLKAKVKGKYKQVAPISNEELWEFPEQQAGGEEQELPIRRDRDSSGVAQFVDVDVHKPVHWPAGLGPGSSVESMKRQLKTRKQPLYGTKQVFWKRLVTHEAGVRHEQYIQQELAGVHSDRVHGSIIQLGSTSGCPYTHAG